MPTVILGLLLPILALAGEFRGKVIAVTDGDTVKVLREEGGSKFPEKIRLLGIDAPEKSQAFGARSKQGLSARIFGRDVTVQTKKKDRYGRTLGKILLDGIDMNLAQVEDGLAWHYVKYRRDQFPGDAALYGAAEARAREAKRGLWADAHPRAPWDYRHGGRRHRKR